MFGKTRAGTWVNGTHAGKPRQVYPDQVACDETYLRPSCPNGADLIA